MFTGASIFIEFGVEKIEEINFGLQPMITTEGVFEVKGTKAKFGGSLNYW